MGKAVADFSALKPDLHAQRGASPDRNKTGLTPAIRAKLLKPADSVESSCGSLGNATPPHKVPSATIGQWRKSADTLRELATGSFEDYDFHTVEQRLGLDLGNAMIWVKTGYN